LARPAKPLVRNLPLLTEANTKAMIPLRALLALNRELPTPLKGVNPLTNKASSVTCHVRVQDDHVSYIDEAVDLVFVLYSHLDTTVPTETLTCRGLVA